jgi:DNA-binding PadR family transcriptional regulator
MHWLGITPPHRAGASGTMLVRPGSLAPAVHRMEEAGWLSAEWGESENRRHTRFYRLTAAGKRQLEEKSDRWAGIAASDQMACALRRIR